MWVTLRRHQLERRVTAKGYAYFTRMDAHGVCNNAYIDRLGRIEKEKAKGKDGVEARVSRKAQMRKAARARGKGNSGTDDITGSASRRRGVREDVRVDMRSRHPPFL